MTGLRSNTLSNQVEPDKTSRPNLTLVRPLEERQLDKQTNVISIHSGSISLQEIIGNNVAANDNNTNLQPQAHEILEAITTKPEAHQIEGGMCWWGKKSCLKGYYYCKIRKGPAGARLEGKVSYFATHPVTINVVVQMNVKMTSEQIKQEMVGSSGKVNRRDTESKQDLEDIVIDMKTLATEKIVANNIPANDNSESHSTTVPLLNSEELHEILTTLVEMVNEMSNGEIKIDASDIRIASISLGHSTDALETEVEQRFVQSENQTQVARVDQQVFQNTLGLGISVIENISGPVERKMTSHHQLIQIAPTTDNQVNHQIEYTQEETVQTEKCTSVTRIKLHNRTSGKKHRNEDHQKTHNAENISEGHRSVEENYIRRRARYWGRNVLRIRKRRVISAAAPKDPN